MNLCKMIKKLKLLLWKLGINSDYCPKCNTKLKHYGFPGYNDRWECLKCNFKGAIQK